MPQGHQKEGLHMSTSLTYSLQAGKCHKTIRKGLRMSTSITYFLQAGKCHKAINKRAGTCQLALLHLLPTSRQMPQDHQQEGLHMSTGITYFLQADKCHKIVSKRGCICQLASLTSYKQANATRPSTKGLGHVK